MAESGRPEDFEKVSFFNKEFFLIFEGEKIALPLADEKVANYIVEETLDIPEAFIYLVRKENLYQRLQTALEQPVREVKKVLISIHYQKGKDFLARSKVERFIARDLVSDDINSFLESNVSTVYLWRKDLPIYVYKKIFEYQQKPEVLLYFLIGSEEKVKEFCQEQRVADCRLRETSWWK